MSKDEIARLGREEHEEREARRQKKRRLRGHKKSRPIARTIREQRAADKGKREPVGSIEGGRTFRAASYPANGRSATAQRTAGEVGQPSDLDSQQGGTP